MKEYILSGYSDFGTYGQWVLDSILSYRGIENTQEIIIVTPIPIYPYTIKNDCFKRLKVLNHFTRILNNYERGLQHNYSQLPRRPNYQREIFINKRIEDYRKIVGDFDQFIEDSGLDVDDFDEGRNLDLIPSSLWDIG